MGDRELWEGGPRERWRSRRRVTLAAQAASRPAGDVTMVCRTNASREGAVSPSRELHSTSPRHPRLHSPLPFAAAMARASSSLPSTRHPSLTTAFRSARWAEALAAPSPGLRRSWSTLEKGRLGLRSCRPGRARSARAETTRRKEANQAAHREANGASYGDDGSGRDRAAQAGTGALARRRLSPSVEERALPRRRSSVPKLERAEEQTARERWLKAACSTTGGGRTSVGAHGDPSRSRRWRAP